MRPSANTPEKREQALLSLEVTAARLGVTLTEVRGMIACGGLRTLDIGGTKFVPEGEVERVQERLGTRRAS